VCPSLLCRNESMFTLLPHNFLDFLGKGYKYYIYEVLYYELMEQWLITRVNNTSGWEWFGYIRTYAHYYTSYPTKLQLRIYDKGNNGEQRRKVYSQPFCTR
jgi:hypothetical protein